MQTVFDYNPTKDELNDLFNGHDVTYRHLLHRSEIDNIWLLCCLFTLRRDHQNYGKFIKLLPGHRRMDFERFRIHLLNG